MWYYNEKKKLVAAYAYTREEGYCTNIVLDKERAFWVSDNYEKWHRALEDYLKNEGPLPIKLRGKKDGTSDYIVGGLSIVGIKLMTIEDLYTNYVIGACYNHVRAAHIMDFEMPRAVGYDRDRKRYPKDKKAKVLVLFLKGASININVVPSMNHQCQSLRLIYA